jgi:hypothetical protein
MAVEARFNCAKKEVIDQVSVRLELSASTGGRDNTGWAPYTPWGQIILVVNGKAADEFVQGGRYRVTFEKVADDE